MAKARTRTREEFMKAASAGDIEAEDFRGVDLAAAKLKEAMVASTNLSSANLRGARITETGVSECDLSGSDLREAIVRSSAIDETNFRGAKLAGASFRETNLDTCDFAEANADGIELKSLGVAADISFANASLVKARFSETSFVGTTNFCGANLTDASMRGVSFEGADFSASNLTNVNFTEANLSGANLATATVKGAKFTRAIYDAKTRWPGVPPADANALKPKKGAAAKTAKRRLASAENVATQALLTPLGYVASFGDPLLLVDAVAAKAWRGTGGAYDTLCEELSAAGGEGTAASALSLPSIAWDIGGEGAGYVFADVNGGLRIVRPWMTDDEAVCDDEGTAAAELANAKRKRRDEIGPLKISCGALAIVASATDASAVDPTTVGAQFEESVLVVTLASASYTVTCDSVEGRFGSARRCFIDPA